MSLPASLSTPAASKERAAAGGPARLRPGGQGAEPASPEEAKTPAGSSSLAGEPGGARRHTLSRSGVQAMPHSSGSVWVAGDVMYHGALYVLVELPMSQKGVSRLPTSNCSLFTKKN